MKFCGSIVATEIIHEIESEFKLIVWLFWIIDVKISYSCDKLLFQVMSSIWHHYDVMDDIEKCDLQTDWLAHSLSNYGLIFLELLKSGYFHLPSPLPPLWPPSSRCGPRHETPVTASVCKMKCSEFRPGKFPRILNKSGHQRQLPQQQFKTLKWKKRQYSIWIWNMWYEISN